MRGESSYSGVIEARPQTRQLVDSLGRDETYWRRTGTVQVGNETYGVRVAEQPADQGGGRYRVEYAEVDGLGTPVDPQYFEAEESAVRMFSQLPGIEDAFRAVWPGETTGTARPTVAASGD